MEKMVTIQVPPDIAVDMITLSEILAGNADKARQGMIEASISIVLSKYLHHAVPKAIDGDKEIASFLLKLVRTFENVSDTLSNNKPIPEVKPKAKMCPRCRNGRMKRVSDAIITNPVKALSQPIKYRFKCQNCGHEIINGEVL